MTVLDRVVGRVGDGIAAARRRSGRFNHVWCAGERFMQVLGGRLAAAIAYYGFFAVFALALVAYAVLGFLLEYNRDVFAAVDQFLKINLPWLEPATIQGSRGRVGLIGLAGLMLTGVGWIEAIRSSQRLVHGVEEQPGHPVLRWLVDLAVLIGLLLLIGASLAVAYALETLVGWLAGGPSALLTIVGWVLAVAVNVVLASALLGGVPRLHLPVRRLAPAVLFVAGGITLLNTVGQMVIERARENPAYTVVTGAVGLLLYLYLFNQLLLFGAALMATSTHGLVRDLAGGRADDMPQACPPPAEEPSGPSATERPVTESPAESPAEPVAAPAPGALTDSRRLTT